MKDVELKLIAELMKNSRRSDRELGKAIGVSQPTVSRMIKKLEKEGYIKEYTMIPDFRKLGFELMSLVYVSYSKGSTDKEVEETRKVAREITSKNPEPILMVVTGMGLGYDRLIVSFHEDYSSYVKHKAIARQLPHLDQHHVESFLLNPDGNHYQPFTFSVIAQYLSTRKAKTEQAIGKEKKE